MDTMFNYLLAIIVIIAIGAIYYLHTKYYFIQYLYFLRIPILVAAVTVVIPIAAYQSHSEVFSNWYELTPIGLGLVSFSSILLAWSIMHMSTFIFENIGERNQLPFKRPDVQHWKAGNRTQRLLEKWQKRNFRRFCFAVLAIPNIAVSMLMSTSSNWLSTCAWTAGGVACNILFASIVDFVHRHEALHFHKNIPEKLVQKAYRTTVFFVCIVSVLYVLGRFTLSPTSPLHEYAPALLYIILVLMLITFVISILTFYLDKHRMPLVMVILILGYIASVIFGYDHYFDMHILNKKNAEELRELCNNENNKGEIRNAFDAWLDAHPKEKYPTIAVIAASGGGITAAYWGALVIKELAVEENLGEQFIYSIPAISAVSGGALGMGYFMDAFEQSEHYPMAPVDAYTLAGRSSLGAVGWGLAYPDFWGGLSGLEALRFGSDRGKALEQRWADNTGIENKRLSTWKYNICEGKQPLALFSATVKETGKRIVFSPLDNGHSSFPDDIWFGNHYAGYDIDIATAIRLSATFPYVTPISRPSEVPQPAALHMADGGYYDNFGVLSALDYLKTIHDDLKASQRKVVLIQIRASSPKHKAPKKAGYFATITGPLETLLNVRTPSQIERNDELVEALKKKWAGDISVETVTFTLNSKAPLSWHLSASDKEKIVDGWQWDKNQKALRCLKFHLGYDGGSEKDCPDKSEAGVSSEKITHNQPIKWDV